MSLLTITELQFIQWDKSNQWNINLDGRNGIKTPAIAVEVGFFGGETQTLGSLQIPYLKNRVYPNLNISYVDDENLTFTNYLRSWYKENNPSEFSVRAINDCTKVCLVSKLNTLKIPVEVWKLDVYPTGQIVYQGDSEASLPIYTVSFVVAGGDL